MRRTFIYAALAFCFASCEHRVDADERTAYYYWETVLDWKESDSRFLEETGVRRLFVRVFDVDWQDGRAVPRAPLQIRNAPGQTIELVPVVFLNSVVMKRLSIHDLDDLASNVVQKARASLGRDFKEIQIDCDWTPSTKESYFFFLKAVRRKLLPQTVLSATIRLHQVKFRQRTGVPPVDRGALMVYGMGSPADFRTENSILDLREVTVYLKGQPPYPLPLDAALPVYSSAVLFHNGKFRRLLGEAQSNPGSGFSRSGNQYCAEQSAKWEGNSLSPGDCIRIERADPDLAASTSELVLPLLAPDSRLILFHYAPGLTRHGSSTIRMLFDRFRHPHP